MSHPPIDRKDELPQSGALANQIYPGLDPPFSGNQGICAKPFDGGLTRHNHHGLAATIYEPLGKISIGLRSLCFDCKPIREIAGTATGEHLVSIDVAQIGQVFTPSFSSVRVPGASWWRPLPLGVLQKTTFRSPQPPSVVQCGPSLSPWGLFRLGAE